LRWRRRYKEFSAGGTTNLNQSSDCTPSFFPSLWPYTMDTRPNHFHRWRSGLSPCISHCQPCARTFRSQAVCHSQVFRSWCRQLQVLAVMPFAEITTSLIRRRGLKYQCGRACIPLVGCRRIARNEHLPAWQGGRRNDRQVANPKAPAFPVRARSPLCGSNSRTAVFTKSRRIRATHRRQST
jgi:hypothetical protein